MSLKVSENIHKVSITFCSFVDAVKSYEKASKITNKARKWTFSCFFFL